MKYNPFPKQDKYRRNMDKISRTVDGILFDSVKEANYYCELKLRRDTSEGDVLFFLRQVPFQIGMEKYIVDFQVFYRNGDVKFIDVKGFRTATYMRKKRLVEKMYPIIIEEK